MGATRKQQGGAGGATLDGLRARRADLTLDDAIAEVFGRRGRSGQAGGDS